MNIVARLKSLTLLKNASIYTGSNILSALVPFFCMPILTRYLEPSDYGIVAMMGSIISFMTPFVGMNVHGAVAAAYYHDNVDFPEFVKSCTTILIVSTIVVTLVVLLGANIIESYTLFPGDWLWTVVVVCFCQYILVVQLTILQVKQKAIKYGTIQIISVVTNTGVSLYLVVVLSMNWQGRVLAQVFSGCLLLVYSIYFLRKNGLLGLSFDEKYIKRALSFGVPLIPHAISGSLMTMADRFFVANFIDIGTAGLFVLGSQIGSGMELLTSSFNKAYVPWLFGNLKNITEEKKVRIVKLTYIYFIAILVIAACYSLLMPSILGILVGEKFYAAGDYIWPFAFAGALNGMYYMVVNYIFFDGATRSLMYRTLTSSLVHLCLSYILIKYYGIIGACYSVVLSYIILFIFVWHLSNRVYNMPWSKFV